MTRPIISLADAIRCQAELRTRGIATVRMLHMLGLDALAASLERQSPGVRAEVRRAALESKASQGVVSQQISRTSQEPLRSGARSAPAAATAAGVDGLTPVETTPAVPPTAVVRTRLRQLPRVAPSGPPAGSSAAPLAPASAASSPPAPPPLFARNHRRGILTAAIATWVPEGPLAIEQVVSATIQRRPILRLPRELRSTVRRGVQLLVDRGESLAPFWRDQDELVLRFRELLGRGRFELVEFRGIPVPAPIAPTDVDPAEGTWEREPGILVGPDSAGDRGWRAPRPGTPVLIVSDFGIGARPDHEEWVPVVRWRRFADELRAAGSPVLGLVPYASARWPAGLRSSIVCLPWSERTSAGTVRRAARHYCARAR
jgi:hypothetical protein